MRNGELSGLQHRDVILVGGGLANGLLAYRLSQVRPDLSVMVVEQGSSLGGNHTWSFHDGDLSSDLKTWITPLVTKSWEKYSVSFPGLQRILNSRYYSVRSERFHEIIAPILGGNLILGQKAEVCTASLDAVPGEGLRDPKVGSEALSAPLVVKLEDGRKFQGTCVIDGRGFRQIKKDKVGYQKFVGLDVTLERPHGLSNPILMDATCSQEDGFRFYYLLPWSETTLLVEDTHYSDSEVIDVAEYTANIKQYITARGWKISSIDRQEVGALPIPLAKGFARQFETNDSLAVVGVRAGLFHPTTGYSFPYAVRLAEAVSRIPTLESKHLKEWIRQYSKVECSQAIFYRLLNRLMFRAAVPELRYKLLERFYGLSEGLVRRFYAGNLNFSDYVRILSGRPPVPIQKAVRVLLERSI